MYMQLHLVVYHATQEINVPDQEHINRKNSIVIFTYT